MFIWFKHFLLVHCVISDPLLLLKLAGSIDYAPLGSSSTTNFTTCALRCRDTRNCRGMAVTVIGSDQATCRLLQFVEYKFTVVSDPQKHKEQIYLRQFTFWNESVYDLKSKNVIEVGTANKYVQRWTTMKNTKCLADPAVFWKNNLMKEQGGSFYQLENGDAAACEASRNFCNHGCTRWKFLVIEHKKGMYVILENAVVWSAICYNGEWMYFDTVSQLVYPVIRWNCATKVARTTPSTPTTTTPTTTPATTTVMPTTTPKPWLIINTRKMGRSYKDPIHRYMKTYEQIPKGQQKELVNFCHETHNVLSQCDLVPFGSANGGSQLTKDTKQFGFQHYGYCARFKGSCNANAAVSTYAKKKGGYMYLIDGSIEAQMRANEFSDSTPFCYFWSMEAKQCTGEISSDPFTYRFQL